MSTKLTIDKTIRKEAVKRCKEQNIILPTFAQQKDPSLVPDKIKAKLKDVGLWDVNSLNLFRITWKNDTKTGTYGDVNYVEIPSEITGVKARIFGLVGKYFPTGAHKVGATYGCLAPRLVTGTFDPANQKAVWPSTGNYCRGGAYNAKLLACDSVAILPEEMSEERFTWLQEIGSEIFATPGCESNVKEIYDKCWELKKERGDKVVVFNQFDEFGNSMWHYNVTAGAIEDVLKNVLGPKDTLAAYVSATGSAGTIAAGDRLKELYPHMKMVASEALQCPTLYNNGYGGHRIEGIGDKHIPWIHNVKNTDVVTAIDDEACMRIMRLFNEKEGHAYLKELGVSDYVLGKLELMGISGIG
ncbi:pyridoxal-phosphate dependent enzyme, partial [bacterium]|nr:pyridoxal-phosphate dependent enzyme [bacterium]